MIHFEIRECTREECRLRIPIETAVHNGDFCPRCSAPMSCVIPAFRHTYSETPNPELNTSFRVVLDNIRSVHNVGAIFRTADGIGIEHLYLCGLTPHPDDHPEIGKTALGAELAVSWSSHPNSLDLAHTLSAKNDCLLALEKMTGAVPITEFRSTAGTSKAVVLFVGNERSGLDPGVLEFCHTILYLPMVGAKESLNVSVAFGAAAYWLMLASIV